MMLRRLLLALVVVLAASAAMSAESYTTAQPVRAKGIEALVAKTGESRPIVRLTIRPDEIVAVTQSDSGSDFAQWTVARMDLGLLNLHFVERTVVSV